MAFVGGESQAYTPPEKLPFKPTTIRDLGCFDDGETIGIGNASNVTITNNYIHDVLNGPYQLEHMLDGVYKNIRINGNLFERTGSGTKMSNFFPNDDPNTVRYQDVYIDNNYWMYNGYFTDRGLFNYSYPLHEYKFFYPQQYKKRQLHQQRVLYY